jgi:hypothetical protein
VASAQAALGIDSQDGLPSLAKPSCYSPLAAFAGRMAVP